MAAVQTQATKDCLTIPAAGLMQLKLPAIPRRTVKSVVRPRMAASIAQKSPLAKAAKAIFRACSGSSARNELDAGVRLPLDPGTPLAKAASAMKKASGVFCKSLIEMSPVAGSAGRALAKKCGRYKCKPLSFAEFQSTPSARPSFGFIENIQPEQSGLQVDSAGVQRSASKRSSLPVCKSKLPAITIAEVGTGSRMSSAFVRFVYQEARAIHKQRSTFQARVEHDCHRCPAAIFMESVHDIKAAIRVCRNAQYFIYEVSAGIRKTSVSVPTATQLDTVPKSGSVEASPTSEKIESAWSDLLKMLPAESPLNKFKKSIPGDVGSPSTSTTASSSSPLSRFGKTDSFISSADGSSPRTDEQ